jgi:hypothetical protein
MPVGCRLVERRCIPADEQVIATGVGVISQIAFGAWFWMSHHAK